MADGREERRAVALIVAVWLLSTLIWLRPGLTRPDGAAYFSWLPSTWLDHDLVLFDEWARFGMLPGGIIQSEGLSANGHLANHWTVGSAFVWYPAFVAGDALRAVVPSLRHFARDGISLPYNAAAVAASAFCGLVALLAGYRAARHFFARDAALLATVAIWFGSPLLWYSTREALMAHSAGAAACALVVLASLDEERSAGTMFCAALATGIAFSIRPQNAAFLAVPFLLGGVPALRRWAFALAGFLLGALPQLLATRILYGSLSALFNVAPRNGQQHSWHSWHAFEHFWPWEPLLSWYHGALTWCPLLMASLIGFAFLWRAHRRLGATAVAMFAVQWFVNATVDRFFWSGSSFGQRRFDNCTIFFLLGAAALFARLPRWLSLALGAAASIWTMALFFAAPVLDLNRYYLPSELWRAVVESPKPLGLLISVPPGFKAAVLTVALVVLALYAGLAELVRRWPAVVGTTACVAFSVWLVLCGTNDAAHLERWRGVIARNRALEPMSGALRDRIALIAAEETYLRKSGRTAEAERTRAELDALRRTLR